MIQLDHSLKRISETKIEFRYRFVNMQDGNLDTSRLVADVEDEMC